jgi:hypothetical protein
MYERHPAFETPAGNRIVWRYMPFANFVWVIAMESLYFSRLDQHDDSWEGLLPKNWSIEQRKYARFTKYVNCWHMNGTESNAMWKLYGNSTGETVAIKTTVGRLINALKESPIPVNIGIVKYEERDLPEGNLYLPVTYKRKAFQHEKELRLCVSSPRNDNPPDLRHFRRALKQLGIHNRSDAEILKDIGDKGISVAVDLNQLIPEVIVCPNSRNSLRGSVQYVLKDKIPGARIRKSKI